MVNVAAAANGGTASASSSSGGGNLPAQAINGDRTASGWWQGASLPAWLQVDFDANYEISEIDVVTYGTGGPPTLSDTSSVTSFGIKDFVVEYWDGAAWQTVATVTNNTFVWRQFTFAPVVASKIRVTVSAGYDGTAKVLEFEGWGVPASVAVTGTGAVVMGAPALAGVGTVTVPPPDPITGTGGVTFAAPAIAGTGTLAPIITSISPHGPLFGLTPVTIHGTDFPTDALSVDVRFGGVLGTSVVVVSSTTITVTAPAVSPGFAVITVTFHYGATDGLIYSEDFSAGPSLWTAAAAYDTPTSPTPGVDPPDPLYPEIVSAADMTVAAGQADWSGTAGDYAAAGFVVRGFPTFNGQRGSMQMDVTPNAASLASLAAAAAPLFSIRNPTTLATMMELRIILSSGIYYFWWTGAPGQPNRAQNFTPVPDVPMTVLLEWQCSTELTSPIDVDDDGWTRLTVDGVLLWDSAEFLYIDPDLANAIQEVWIGYGLYGAIDRIEFRVPAVIGPDDVEVVYAPFALPLVVPTASIDGWAIDRIDLKPRKEETA